MEKCAVRRDDAAHCRARISFCPAIIGSDYWSRYDGRTALIETLRFAIAFRTGETAQYSLLFARSFRGQVGNLWAGC
jgi:hypothetical protein